MNYGNEDTRYFGGIPSSIISYSADRGRYQAYDGIYDITNTTSQQLINLQDQLSVVQKQIYDLQNIRASTLLSTIPNLLVNGDCSQYTLVQPTVGTVNAGANNVGFQLQGRAVPIMDRWYHVAELAGVTPQNVKFECSQTLLTSYINPLTSVEFRPQSCTRGMKCVWKNATGATTDMFALEHTKAVISRVFEKSGAILAVQHMVPDVTLTVNKVYSLGFWLYTNYTSKGMIRILRQYNTTGGGGNKNTEYSLQHIHIKSFNFTSGWNYVETTFTTSTLGGQTISGLNGLVVQIGPFYYTWKLADNGSTVSELYGALPTGQASYEWVVTEIQLRTDATASKTNFMINPYEQTNTLPYMCATSSTGVEMLDHPGVILDTPTVVAANPIYTHTFTLDFAATVRLPYKMKEAPQLILFNGLANGITKSIGGYFVPNNNNYSAGDYMGPMWNGMDLFGVSWSYTGRRLWSDGGANLKSEMIAGDSGWPTIAKISFITDSSFRFQFSTSKTFVASTYSALEVQDPIFYFGGPAIAKFVGIVPETHMGQQNRSEFLDYVDYSWTALTSRPFSVSI